MNDKSKLDQLKELVEQTTNDWPAGVTDDEAHRRLIEMTDLVGDLLERPVVGSVEDRDLMTIERLRLAAAAIGAAMKSMPNNTSSIFSSVDIRSLAQTERTLRTGLTLLEEELSRA